MFTAEMDAITSLQSIQYTFEPSNMQSTTQLSFSSQVSIENTGTLSFSVGAEPKSWLAVKRASARLRATGTLRPLF